MAQIPAPENTAVDVAKAVLAALIEGLGVDAAFAAGVAKWPFLGAPIVRNIFRWIVEQLAEVIDKNLFNFSMSLIIRIQSEARKAEFNEALKPIIKGDPTDDEIKAARAAADRLIERNRP